MSGSEDKDQKTEEASEGRKAELRKEGKVVQSHDVVSAAAMVGAVATLSMTTSRLAADISGLALRSFRLVDHADPLGALKGAVGALTGALPALVGASVAAIVAGLAQTKGLFSIELAMPKLERLDPMSRLAQLVPGKEMATELGKSLLKIITLGIVMYQIVKDSMPTLLALGAEDARVAAGTVGACAGRALMWAAVAFAVIAAIDWAVASQRFNADAMMTKQELKEEHKQEEQSPEIKRRMRQKAREILAQAKVGDLSKATVLVTNPTHFAVALRYDPELDAVPIVVAKALDERALQMRTQARGYRIPIVENRPLARALHKKGKIGKPIPSEMYRAVAEIIAHVMRLRAGVRS